MNMPRTMHSSILPYKPLLFTARDAHARGLISYLRNGTAVVRIGKDAVRVPRDHQYDLTQATIFGLNERLTMAATSPVVDGRGRTLRDLFNAEWARYTDALECAAAGRVFDYGVYAYYARRNDLVRYCVPYWHRVVSVASSSTLLSDPKGKLSWREIRDVLESTTVAVAGASVGNNIIHSLVMDLRPDHVKIADKSLYKMENINRVRLGYWDVVAPQSARREHRDTLLRNKAIVTAEQLYAIDPYLDVFVYGELGKDTIGRFFGGGRGEPAADVVVEEIDDPKGKLFIREEARRRRIPLIMLTDVGSSVQLDVLRYDKRAGLPLTYGTSDKELYARMRAVYENPGDRRTFFAFVDALVGTGYRRGELKHIVAGTQKVPTSTIIPQLGSTAAMGGAVVAEAIARIRLGYDYPPRATFDKSTFRVKIFS